MKTLLSVLLLATAPAIALASGDHDHDHDRKHGDHHAMEHEHDHHEAAIGRPGKASAVTRTVEVAMDDTMRFTPGKMVFRAGETVRFVVSNHGKIRHEMVLGNMAELKEHMQMMQKNPNMQHADPNMISLAPGEQGELIWQFTRPGQFDFACLVPGHMEAGMSSKIAVK